MAQQDRLRPLDNQAESRPPRRRTTLVVFLVLLVSVMALTLRMVIPYMLAVVMGGILALLSQPVYRWLRRHRFGPTLASAVVTIGVLLLVVAPLSFFAFKAIQQGVSIGRNLAEGGLSFRALIDRVSAWGPVEAAIGSPEALEAQARRWIQTAGAGATAAILKVAAQLPNLLLQLALASLACFFFLIDGKRFLRWSADKVPLDADVRVKVVESFKGTAISVIWATLAAAAAQAGIMGVSYLVLGVPAAFLAAGATFIFAWIPILGSTPVWVTGAVYLFVQGSVVKGVLMIAFGLVAGVTDNFVRPWVLRGRGNIHPLVSLVAIFGGISMFGIMGIFIGPIVAAVLISLLQIWPAVGSRFGLLPASPQLSAPSLQDGEPTGNLDKAV